MKDRYRNRTCLNKLSVSSFGILPRSEGLRVRSGASSFRHSICLIIKLRNKPAVNSLLHGNPRTKLFFHTQIEEYGNNACGDIRQRHCDKEQICSAEQNRNDKERRARQHKSSQNIDDQRISGMAQCLHCACQDHAYTAEDERYRAEADCRKSDGHQPF